MVLGLSIVKRSLKNTAGHYRWKTHRLFAGEKHIFSAQLAGQITLPALLPPPEHQNWRPIMSDILIVDDERDIRG